MMHKRKTSNHCPRCGRWLGDVLCQCRINQVRREMIDGRNMEMCLAIAEKREMARAGLVAEVCGEIDP